MIDAHGSEGTAAHEMPPSAVPGMLEIASRGKEHGSAKPRRQSARHRWSGWADKLYRSQPERLIRLARLTSAAFALLAIFLDPTQPTRYGEEAYAILLGYLIYSALLAAAPSREALNSRAHYLTHAIDIAVLCFLSLLTGELASPFLSFFSFALIVSAIRWGLTGSFLTAIALDLLLMALGWPYDDPSKSDLNGLIMRSAYALVAAAMLGYFASHRERSRQRLAQLAAWPIEAVAYGGEPWLERSLRHASEVLGGLRLLVVWSDAEEPMGRIAFWDCHRCIFLDILSDDCERILATGQTRASFHHGSLREAVRLPEPIARHIRHDLIHIAHNKPPCCSALFRTQRYFGRVFVVDPGYPSEDMLSLTEIVAERIAFELEQFAMMQELATAAGWRERNRLARDLHDSVLQDLTAAGLQIRIASQQPLEQVRATLGLVGGLVQEQQRRIRTFVENQRPPDGAGEQQVLGEHIAAIGEVLSRQWRCELAIDIDPNDLTVSRRMSAEICQMVSEAMANAVRHGGATKLDILIRSGGPGLDIHISDNGSGISGEPSAAETRPESIGARVADLGGRFRLLDAEFGLTMHIWLPT